MLADGPLALLLLGSILPLGAIHVPIFLAVAAVAILAAVRELLSPEQRTIGVPGVAALLLGLSAYTAFQALPIPVALLARLSPVAADVWSRSLSPLGEAAPRLASLSLDPGASWVEALKWWTYAAVFFLASSFGARHGMKWGAVLILGASLVVALSTIGHGVSNATRVFGLYTPTMGGRGWGIGPLVNANVLAGYLNIGLLAGLGLVASSAPPLPRWLLSIAVATVLGVCITTGSRGGVAALLVGLMVAAPLIRRARIVEGGLSRRDRSYAIAAAVLALAMGAVFATIAATGTTKHLLSDPSLSKLRMALWVPPMLKDYPWFGVGRGAFESVFLAYKTSDSNSVYTHPENFLIQWATEWGLPVACGIVVALLWLLRPRAWGAGRDAAGSGLFAGFFALAVQNLVDLGLEVPGVAVAASAAAGVAWGAREGGSGTAVASWAGGKALPALVLPIGIGLFALAALVGTHTLREDREAIRRALPERPKDASEWPAFKSSLMASMKRHPAEPYFPRQGAFVTMVGNGESPVPWLQRTLELSGGSGRTHYLLSVLLARHGIRSQALLELRYAVLFDQDLSGRVARLALRLTRNYDDLMRVVPDGGDGVAVLSSLATTVQRNDKDLAYRFYLDAIERDPTKAGPRRQVAQMLLSDLADRRFGSRCAEERRATCQKAILGHIRALARAMPKSDEPLELAVRLLLVAGRPVQATALVSSLCPTLPVRSRCMRIWVEASAESGDPEEFKRAIKFAQRDGCASPKACAETYTTIGNVVSRLSGPHAALPYYKRAVTEDPSKANWVRVARVAAFIGEHAEASAALARAAAFSDASPEIRESLERERNRAMFESIKRR